jgi:hypothetical protein
MMQGRYGRHRALARGSQAGFDGYYPSFMSPSHAAGHLGKTGLVFFMNGCNVKRKFQSRTFTITTK